MYRRQIEEYLIHYHPNLMEEMLQAGTLQGYLSDLEEAMLNAKEQIVAQLTRIYPQMSEVQRSLEADQAVRETFLRPKS